MESRIAILKEEARAGRLIRTSDLVWARVKPDVPCECGAKAGASCRTPSGWHYSRRDALVSKWRREAGQA